MKGFEFSKDNGEESEQSFTAMSELSVGSLDEEIELDRIDYETLLEEIRASWRETDGELTVKFLHLCPSIISEILYLIGVQFFVYLKRSFHMDKNLYFR